MNASLPNRAAPQSIMLGNGRRLAWYEYGAPDGKPCIYTAGTPASGLCGALYHECALRAGVRWISPDKPGYGHSDFQPDRRLLDWASDIGELADHLGIARFAVAGESGGGPHVLALAHALPDRVTVAIDVCGMGPAHDAASREGMKPELRRLIWLANHLPWLAARLMAHAVKALRNPARREKMLQRQIADAPRAEADVLRRYPQVLPLVLDAYLDAFRSDGRAAVHEFRMFTRPWGFALSDIPVPVHLFHGTEDLSVPIAIARRVAAELPNCEARYIEGAGHALLDVFDDVVRIARDAR